MISSENDLSKLVKKAKADKDIAKALAEEKGEKAKAVKKDAELAEKKASEA